MSKRQKPPTRDQADDLYEETLAYLRERALFVDELAPLFIASIGAHYANLRQHREGLNPFWLVKGVKEDLRLPLVTVAPSGLSKSYMMKFFIKDGKFGLMDLHSGWEGKITEAGFVGTVKDDELMYGAAWEYREGVMAYNELTNVLMAAMTDHSAELVNQLMECLSEGKVFKRLASGRITYESLVTLWGGVQPRRFDMTAGLMRRLCPVVRIWSREDLRAIQKGRRDRGLDERWNPKEIQEFRLKFREVGNNLKPESATFSNPLFDYMEEKCDGPYVQMMAEKAINGIGVIKDPSQRNYFYKKDKTNMEIVRMVVKNIRSVAMGSDISLMVNTINKFGAPPTVQELFNTFRGFSYNYGNFNELLTSCIRMGLLKKRNGKVYTLLTLKKHGTVGMVSKVDKKIVMKEEIKEPFSDLGGVDEAEDKDGT